MNTLFDIWHTTQTRLFPWIEERLDPLSEKEQQFVRVVSLMDLPGHMREYRWTGIGRRRQDRVSIAKAFVAKAVYNFETTKLLIEYLKGCKNLRRLCGWEARTDIPSESTFSRAFAEYSRGCLPQKIHEAMVKTYCGEKLAGHVSRDSTAIEAREKPVKKREGKAVPEPKRKRGRPKKGEEIAPKPPKRLDLQVVRRLDEGERGDVHDIWTFQSVLKKDFENQNQIGKWGRPCREMGTSMKYGHWSINFNEQIRRLYQKSQFHGRPLVSSSIGFAARAVFAAIVNNPVITQRTIIQVWLLRSPFMVVSFLF